MRTFIYSFDGFWPVGAYAVVCAKDRETADSLFAESLKDRSEELWKKNSVVDVFEPSGYKRILDFEEVDVQVMPLNEEYCNIISDGEY